VERPDRTRGPDPRQSLIVAGLMSHAFGIAVPIVEYRSSSESGPLIPMANPYRRHSECERPGPSRPAPIGPPDLILALVSLLMDAYVQRFTACCGFTLLVRPGVSAGDHWVIEGAAEAYGPDHQKIFWRTLSDYLAGQRGT